jgi:hypothetical protein
MVATHNPRGGAGFDQRQAEALEFIANRLAYSEAQLAEVVRQLSEVNKNLSAVWKRLNK